MRRGGSFDDVCDHPPGPVTTSYHVSVPPMSMEVLLAVSPSRGETNHPLFLSLFRDFDD